MLADRVVLGTWGLAGAYTVDGAPIGYAQLPAERVDEVLDAAWDAGLRWVDVAPGYGAGAGLRVLAGWQRRRGRTWRAVVKPGRAVGADGPRSDVSVTGVAAELRDIEAVLPDPAGVLVKDPPEAAFADGSLTALLTWLARRGGVPGGPVGGVVGIATHRLDLAARLGAPPVPGAVVQLEYHLLNRHVAVPTAATLAARGWQVWAMQPRAYGFLGGRYDATTRFPADDWRSRIPARVRAAFAASAALLPGWLPPTLRARPLAEVALAWCLADENVARVVVGPRRAAHVATAGHALALAPSLTDRVHDAR